MAKHLLTDLAVKRAQPRGKPYRMADGGGLYLYVPPSGVKSWQYRYRHDGKQQTATLGKPSSLSLAEAREKADRVRRQASEGVHITNAKRVQRLRKRAEASKTFNSFAAHWITHESRRRHWSSDYRLEVERSIDRHLGSLHQLPLGEITAPVAVSVLRDVERTAPMMAEKIRRRLRGILDFAVEEGLLPGNPLPARQRGPKIKRRHFPAVTDWTGVGEILRKASAADPAKGVTRAHILVAFTAQRIAEVVGAQWNEFDLLETGVWSIPRARMKVRDEERGPHQVPITRQLLAELNRWREADGPSAVLVCPAPRDPARSITPEAVEKHYRDVLGLAGRHSPHSWRSTFKTMCGDAGKASEVVESQLDHVIGSKVASAYDRSKRLELRRALMQWYEGQLIAACDGGEVVQLRRRRT